MWFDEKHFELEIFYLLEIRSKKQFTARAMTCFTGFTRTKKGTFSYSQGLDETVYFISAGDQVKLHSSTFYFCLKIVVSTIKITTMIFKSAVSHSPHEKLVQFHLVHITF